MAHIMEHMANEHDVYQALRGVVDPELGGDIVELGMVTDVDIADGVVTVGVALTIAQCPMRGQIEQDTARKVMAIPGVRDVVVRTTAMTRKQRSELMSTARRRAREDAEPTQVSPTTRVIAVGSGKGGVGKSSVAVNLAVALADLGLGVGLMDADIWGFSVPRMLGVADRLAADDDTRLIIPAEAAGIRVVSTGLIIESEETALMWRGLMLSRALEQFLKQVAWGDLDYLVIDMPPGTGDIQMALSRMVPQAEMVVVTTPQKAAQKVAIRVADMARRSYLPVVGVIENMAGFTCEHGETHNLFGEGGGRELADSLGVPLIASVPLDPAVVSGGDTGLPVVRADAENPAARAFAAAAERLVELVPPAEDETCTARIARLLEGLETQEVAAATS
jgi:ATP-binding protein involved in chromosome partitioning